ncbi:shikimate dehydrogenase [Streptomyces sp. W16]|uniref:shikimate dehydrogenase family protein n=1 Tax=Streptomyces sp. W16 TaxID=3076631 RepID=UPI00295B6C6B|nr:shikimate dehydrogenase [Streptomyces sp. W16]MDV9169067.1 shikimate dehydrogenase [Streptomyces sp. W16]
MRTSPRVAVLGSDVARSATLRLQRIAQAALELAGTCVAIECDEEGLAPVVTSLDPCHWTAFVLLPPLERAVVALLDDVTPVARALARVDTVTFADGRWRGENTRAQGIADAARRAGVRGVRRAVVLGAGDGACVALAALRSLGPDHVDLVMTRPAEHAAERAVAHSLAMGLRTHPSGALAVVLRTADILVSALPPAEAAPYSALIARSGVVVLDLARLAEGRTRLVRAVAFAGGTVIDGLEPLLQRTVRQAELLTGRPGLTVEALRAAVPRALAGAEA